MKIKFTFFTLPLIISIYGNEIAVVKIADVPAKSHYITQPTNEKNI